MCIRDRWKGPTVISLIKPFWLSLFSFWKDLSTGEYCRCWPFLFSLCVLSPSLLFVCHSAVMENSDVCIKTMELWDIITLQIRSCIVNAYCSCLWCEVYCLLHYLPQLLDNHAVDPNHCQMPEQSFWFFPRYCTTITPAVVICDMYYNCLLVYYIFHILPIRGTFPDQLLKIAWSKGSGNPESKFIMCLCPCTYLWLQYW